MKLEANQLTDKAHLENMDNPANVANTKIDNR